MKLIHTLFFIALTLAATTCHAEQRSKLDQLFDDAAKAAGMIKDRGKPRQADKNRHPQVIIKGSEIRYNGQVLKLGDDLGQWEKVLGKASRFDRSIYTWDEVGIQCWTDWKESKRTEALTIFEMTDQEFHQASMPVSATAAQAAIQQEVAGATKRVRAAIRDLQAVGILDPDGRLIQPSELPEDMRPGSGRDC